VGVRAWARASPCAFRERRRACRVPLTHTKVTHAGPLSHAVVMITAESKDEKKQEGKVAGATGWLVKPFTPKQLLAVVKKVIG
jgi:CheY-like chemotaxis protein